MFNGKTTKKEIEELSNSSTTVGKGTTLEGNVETFGNLRVEGKVVGSIKTKSKLATGDSAHIEGAILAQNAEIACYVKGKVEVSDLLVLKSTAQIHGDIVTNKLVVEAGASFNGMCKMGATVKEISIGEQGEEFRTAKEGTA
jgi:cytoskeletal protein CcmA (bactofilin family)